MRVISIQRPRMKPVPADSSCWPVSLDLLTLTSGAFSLRRHAWSVDVAILLVLVYAKVGLADCTLTSTGKTPLNDLGSATYLGSMGGLYPNGSNTRPAFHELAGELIAQSEVVPRDAAGNVNLVTGKIVLISVGMSNTTQEFATRGQGAFLPRINADSSRNPKLVVVDCAQGGHAAKEWRDPANDAWLVCAQRLTNAGVTAAQVQAAWVKLAERTSDVPDKSFPAHALFHQPRLGEVVRLLKASFPNLAMAFMSSRTRSYENNLNSLNPEPFSYEENFSVKWLIEEQINGTGNLNYDPDLGLVLAPYIVWGPYIWTDGEVPRSDGFVWHCADLVSDFTHPSESGAAKVADQLIAFFKTDPLATPWFLRTEIIGQPPSGSITADSVAGPAPLQVDFTADVTDPDGAIVEYAWTFGDGGFSLAQDPAKTFYVPGTYVIRLTVTDDDGNPATFARTITVGESADAVPAASTWGLMLFFLLTLIGGTIVLRRDRVQCEMESSPWG